MVTGTLEGFSRAEAKKAIEALGGKVTGSVSANTDCVVVGADSGSKADKAKQLGIKTLNETAFKRLLGGTPKQVPKKKTTKIKATTKKITNTSKNTGPITPAGRTFVVTNSLQSFSQVDAKSKLRALGAVYPGGQGTNIPPIFP